MASMPCPRFSFKSSFFIDNILILNSIKFSFNSKYGHLNLFHNVKESLN